MDKVQDYTECPLSYKIQDYTECPVLYKIRHL